MNKIDEWINAGLAAEILATDTTAFRICSARDSWVDRFGNAALISGKSSFEIQHLLEALQSWSKNFGWTPERVFSRLLVREPGQNDLPMLISGDANISSREVVLENGLQYEVDFSVSYSPGLFCDQRANRTFLRNLKPRRVLNTFAYTCAFSVAAAMSGARTVNVDISKSSLQRGRRNFELNSLDLSDHRFVVEDTLTYLRRLMRREEKFDAIVLDPPTFGRGGKGKTFQIEKDFESLLRAAIELAAPGAAILLSVNYTAWDVEKLRSIARAVAPNGTSFHAEPSPSDFSSYTPSAAIWMMLGR